MQISELILRFKVYLIEQIISIAKSLVIKDSFFTKPFLFLTNFISNTELKVYDLFDTSEIADNKTVLCAAQNAETAEPKQIDGSQVINIIQLPAIGFVKLTDAIIDPSSPVIRLKKKAVVQTTASKELKKAIMYSGRQLHANGEKTVLFQTVKSVKIANGIVFSGSYERNWYHFLVEILPRLELLDKLPEEYQGFPLIFPASILDSDNSKQILSRLTSDREVIFMEKQFSYCVSECIFIESPVLAPPRIRGECMFIRDAQHIRPEIIRSFRNRILKTFSDAELEYRNDEPKRIFLARGEYSTRPYNQDEVFAIFKQLGFEAVYCERLTILEQIRLFRHAEYIVGPSGAAWTNILFCESNPKGLCFLAKVPNIEYASPFSNLAHVFGIDLRYYYETSNFLNWSDLNYPTEQFIFDAAALHEAARMIFQDHSFKPQPLPRA